MKQAHYVLARILIIIYLIFQSQSFKFVFSQQMGLSNVPFERLPILLITRFINPQDTARIFIKTATCFVMEFRSDSVKHEKYIISNFHPFELFIQKKRVSVSDSGTLYINAKDTVISLRVKVRAVNTHLDLALLTPRDPIPPILDTIRFAIALHDLDSKPNLSERIAYAGFPLEKGVDASRKRNYPLTSIGYIAQVVPDVPTFLFQAPVFEGASGSPIVSLGARNLKGIVSALPGIPRSDDRQESFGVAIRADTLIDWIESLRTKNH